MGPAAIPASGATREIKTNPVWMPRAPTWLTAGRVERVADRIQDFLEWQIRRVTVHWYERQDEFERVHRLGPTVTAVTMGLGGRERTIHIGPSVTTTDFDAIFGHELVHVVLAQKYRGAVPRWLEEGMACFISRRGRVDYASLRTRTLPPVRNMGHPFKSADPALGYQSSTAVMEMIASRCDVHDLLQMSVAKGLETYLTKLCQIRDLDAELKKWVDRRAGAYVKK